MINIFDARFLVAPPRNQVLIRRTTKQNEIKATKNLTRIGKYFLPIPKNDYDLKQVLNDLIAAEAGRSFGGNSSPSKPWAPELLSGAISHIGGNQDEVKMRTVQLWFQHTEKGIRAFAAIGNAGKSDHDA